MRERSTRKSCFGCKAGSSRSWESQDIAGSSLLWLFAGGILFSSWGFTWGLSPLGSRMTCMCTQCVGNLCLYSRGEGLRYYSSFSFNFLGEEGREKHSSVCLPYDLGWGLNLCMGDFQPLSHSGQGFFLNFRCQTLYKWPGKLLISTKCFEEECSLGGWRKGGKRRCKILDNNNNKKRKKH